MSSARKTPKASAGTSGSSQRSQAQQQRAQQARQQAFSGRRVPRPMPMARKEVNYVDLASAVYAFNTTGSITLIATIAQGAGIQQRVGKRVQLKSIEGRGLVTSDSTATVAGGRMLIVYDKRPTGALPAITDILGSINYYAFNNDDNSGRFLILKNQPFVCTGNNTTAGQINDSSMQVADFYLKLTKKQLMTTYKAVGTGAIGDIEMGALYLVTVGNVVAGTADCNVTIGFRTRFFDIN